MSTFYNAYANFGHSTNALPILSRGSQGEAVKILQVFLYQVGHYYGTIDGHFCPQTENSVRALQYQIGIPSNGIVDRRTWRAITRIQKTLGY